MNIPKCLVCEDFGYVRSTYDPSSDPRQPSYIVCRCKACEQALDVKVEVLPPPPVCYRCKDTGWVDGGWGNYYPCYCCSSGTT